MKKIWILAIVAFMMASITACGGEKTTENGEGTTPANTTAGNAADAANGEVKEGEPAPSNLPPTTVQFNSITHDFGKIKEGEIVSHKFLFKNTGSNPLKIDNVKPSCGCTTPDYTKEEVAAGGEGFVAVEFNSSGKEGPQTKTVNVTLNTAERNLVLTFTGEVVKEAK